MKISPAVLFAVQTFGLMAALQAVDWPQWRGPNRDAVISDPKFTITSLPAEPKVLWKIPVGLGLASPVVSGSSAVYLDAQSGQETVHCVDAATGKPVWSVPLAPTVTFSNYQEGPRCTPLIDGDRLYVQSSSGEFRCLALATGKTIWHTNFETDYGAKFLGNSSNDPEANQTASRRHGNNGSAAIDGDRIFVPVGSPKGATLVAFEKKTGKEIWRAGTDNTAYASVMVGTLAGTRQVVHFTADALMGVDAHDGKILWREPLKTGAKRHVCTPVISGDFVVVASTNIGTIKFHIVKNGSEYKAERAWTDAPLKTILGTPTLVGKFLYTVGAGSRADLVCVDFETGKELWSQPGLSDYASITAVNDKLLVLNSTGELTLVAASPEQYKELGRMQVSGKTWSSPAYKDGRILVKDDTSLKTVALTP